MQSFFAIHRLSAYLDGELSAAEAEEVRRAIEDDAEVRAELERIQSGVDLLRTHGRVAAPAGFKDRVLREVALAPPPRGVVHLLRRFPWEAAAVGLAAALVLVAVGIPQGQESSPATTLSKDAPLALPPPVAVPARPPPLGSGTKPPQAEQADAEPEELQAPRSTPKSVSKAAPKGSEQTTARGQAGQQAGLIDLNTGFTPDEPYVPDWDQDQAEVGAEGGEPPPSNTGEAPPQQLATARVAAWRLFPRSPDALQALAALAADLGGSVVTADGRPFAPRSLGADDDLMVLQVQIPEDRQEEFGRRLASLGMASALRTGDERLFGGGMIMVQVEVQYTP